MTETQTDAGDPQETLTVAEAAEVLGVEQEQVDTMVADGLLVPDHGAAGAPRFTRAAVLAVKQQGG